MSRLAERTRGYFGATMVLGLNAWVMIVAWPALLLGPDSPLTVGVGLVPLGVLGAGLFTQRTDRWLLLAFPVSLALAVATRPEEQNRLVHTPGVLFVSALALLGFGVSARLISRGGAQLRQASHAPFVQAGWISPERSPRLRRLCTGLILATSLGLVTLAPTWGGSGAAQEAWGQASKEGALFTVLVGMSVAILMLVSFLGPMLRAEPRAGQLERNRGRRALWWFGLAALGATTYALTGS